MIVYLPLRPKVRITALAPFLVLAAGCHASQATGLAPGRYMETLQSGGIQRSFIVDVPKAYSAGSSIPLVIVFHGWTATAVQAEKYTRMQEEGEAQGFVTVFPDGVGKGWNAGFINLTGQTPDDVKFTNDLLDHLEKEINVDKNREYVCGHSNGAFMANYLGSKLSGRLAAIGSVAGTIGLKSKQISVPDSPISVILIHGKKDPMVAYSEGGQALLKGIGAEESAEWWAKQDGCSPAAATTKSADGNVETEVFSGGKGDAEVELVSIANGVHDWPGGWGMKNGSPSRETTTNVDAADLLWQFFKAHPKGGG